jgi:SAM-dependent methyltransferase
LVLADAGVAVVGLDRSAAMLCVARRKAAERGVALSLVRGDLRAFAFGRRFDLVVCCFDSLNYLTEPHEFIAALRCARDALAEGGIFICDLTTRYAYTGELNGVTHEFDLGDLAYRWRTTWDERGGLAMTDIRLLVREGGRESRCAERHTQRPYAPGEVRAALRQAGLRPLATHGVGAGGEPALEPPAADAPRAIYVAGRAP